MSLGSTLTKIFPDLRILLLNGPLGAGKTTLVKGIAKKSKKFKSPLLLQLFLYPNIILWDRLHWYILIFTGLKNKMRQTNFFLQEEEESKAIGALMVVEWPERLSLPMPDAWRGKLEYSSENQSRFFSADFSFR